MVKHLPGSVCVTEVATVYLRNSEHLHFAMLMQSLVSLETSA